MMTCSLVFFSFSARLCSLRSRLCEIRTLLDTVSQSELADCDAFLGMVIISIVLRSRPFDVCFALEVLCHKTIKIGPDYTPCSMRVKGKKLGSRKPYDNHLSIYQL